MRCISLLASLLITTAALAQTGGDIRGLDPPKPVPDLGLGEIPALQDPSLALNKPANDALDKLIDKYAFDKTPLGDALERLAKDMHLNMSVNWPELERAGLSRTSPVSLNVAQIPVRKVLSLLLDEVRATAYLHFVVDSNQLVISTKDDLQSAQYQIVKIFDLRPLFADWELESPQAAQAAQALVETIQSVVDSDTWRENGGIAGYARVLNGKLIVNQTVENQIRVSELLHELTANPARPTRAYDIRDLIKDAAPAPAAAGPVQPGTVRPLPPKVQSLITAIQVNCGRDTWRDLGGKTSSLAYFEGKLYITTRGAIHDQIEQLLALMRK